MKTFQILNNENENNNNILNMEEIQYQKNSNDYSFKESKETIKNIDDLGNIVNILPENILNNFITSKWEDKKEGLIQINNYITNSNDSNLKFDNNLFELYNFIKEQLKNFKETNINLIKESLNLFNIILPIFSLNNNQIEQISKELMKGFYEKFADVKLNYLIEKLFILIANINTKLFYSQILSKLKTEKKNNILKSYSIFFENFIKKKGNIEDINKNDIITYCINMSGNRDPQIRNASLNLLCILYYYIGYDLRKILSKEIKDSTYKLIEESFNKIDNENMNSYLNSQNVSINNNNSPFPTSPNKKILYLNTNSNMNTPIKDILKNNSIKNEILDYNKILKIIDEGKWVDRKENLEKLINELKNNFENKKNPPPINNIMQLIKNKLNDNQKKLVLLIINLLNVIIDNLKEAFNKEYLITITIPLINNLNDNNELIRKETLNVIYNVLSHKENDFLIISMINSLKIEKYNLRNEILNIFLNYKDNLSKKNITNLIEPLLLCLTDKSNDIRNMSINLIQYFKNINNIQEYYDSINILFKKVSAEQIKNEINKIYEINNNDNNNIPIFKSISSKTLKNKTISGKNSFRIDSYKNNNKDTTISNSTLTTQLLDKSKKINISNIYKSKTLRSKSKDLTLNKSISKDKKIIENVYKNYINFIEMKKIRNKRDLKLNINFDSILENEINDLENKFLNKFLTDNYISNIIIPNKKQFYKIIKYFKNLITKENFKENFYPNYDLILKYIILNIYSKDLLIDKNIYDNLIIFFNTFYEQLKLSDCILDEIELKLTLEFFINLKYNYNDNQNKLINIFRKFINIIKIEISFNYILIYSINCDDIKIKYIALYYFIEELNRGKINIEKNLKNFKLLISYFYLNDIELKEKVKEIFLYIYNTFGENFFNEFLLKLNQEEKEILLSNLNINNSLYSSNYSNKNNNNLDNYLDYDSNNNNNNTGIYLFQNNSTYNSKSSCNYNNYCLIQSKFDNSLFSNNESIKRLKSFNSNKLNNNINNNEYKTEKLNNTNSIKKLNTISYNNLPILNNDMEIIEILNEITKTEDINNKINYILTLKEIFGSKKNFNLNKDKILINIDLIIQTISCELEKIFNINNIYLKSIKELELKYITLLNKIFEYISNNKIIIETLNLETLQKICLTFFNYLQVDNSKKVNKNYKSILEDMNTLMLSFIQNSTKTHILISLLNIAYNYKDCDISILSINCILYLLKKNIDFNKLNNKALLAVIIKNANNLEINEKNNRIENIIKCMKKLLNEMIKVKNEKILDDYKECIKKNNIKDNITYIWINKILEHMKNESNE